MVRLAKRTYSLPPDVVQRFEKRLAPGDRSAFVASLIQGWLDETEREQLRRRVIEGCKEMSAVNQDLAQEWDPATEEVWREDN
jgi:hypothetical protein